MCSNSAGTGAQLFGDRRAILFLDLTVKNSGAASSEVLPFNLVPEGNSEYGELICHLKAYHNPPEYPLCYVMRKEAAVRALVERRLGHVNHIVILAAEGRCEEDEETLSRVIGHIASLSPSCLMERAKAIRPSLVLVTKNGLSNAAVPIGVDTCLTCGPGDGANVAARFSDLLHGAPPPSLNTALTRASIHGLEEARARRNALGDPYWIAKIIDDCFEHLPLSAEFPEIGEEERQRLDAAIDKWDFFAPNLTRIECFHVILLIFQRLDLVDGLEVDLDALKRFILLVERNYHPNPYHNFYHAVDVLQCCHYVLTSSMMLQRMLKPLDVFALFVAAISHDLGHTSFNNPFTVENESLLAWLYNDKAVLENMHAATLFAILRHPRYNFSHSWARSQWREFRSLVLAAILGTDMGQHFDFIRLFTGMDGAFARSLKCLNNGEGPLPLEDRRLLLVSILKFSDICNVIRPFEWARRWGFHLVCEFFHQGDWEKALGYASTPMTTRNVTDLAKGQQYFLNNIASPLYRCMAEYFTELSFAETHLRANLEAWKGWRPDEDDIIQTYADLYPSTVNGEGGRGHRHRSH